MILCNNFNLQRSAPRFQWKANVTPGFQHPMQFRTSKSWKPLELPTSADQMMQRQWEAAFPKKARACVACAAPPQPPKARAQSWPGFLTSLKDCFHTFKVKEPQTPQHLMPGYPTTIISAFTVVCYRDQKWSKLFPTTSRLLPIKLIPMNLRILIQQQKSWESTSILSQKLCNLSVKTPEKVY